MVIGGGPVAERKVRSLIKAGAAVKVISPDLTRGLMRMKEAGGIRHYRRPYRSGDLKGAFIVVAATDSEETNRRIAAEAPALLNVVDVPPLCNFIAPSIVRRGKLVMAVSTSGVSPALARSIRKELEGAYGYDFSSFLKFLKVVRTKARSVIADRRQREHFLKGIASEDMLRIFRTKGLAEVKGRIRAGLRKYTDKKG